MLQRGRRTNPRLRLRLAARAVLLEGTRSCILTDLSASGARLRIDRRVSVSDQVVLSWGQGLEAFGDIVWATETHCGVVFEEPLREAVLHAARRLSDSDGLPDDRELTRRTAAAFVRGAARL
jgi:hypothetical protein